MATIRTAIELYDSFSAPIMDIINAVNSGVSAMYEMQEAINAPVDTASIDAARDSIDQATIAAQQLDAAMQGMKAPVVGTPAAPQVSDSIKVPVEPDVPDPLVETPPPVNLPVEPIQPEPVQVPVVWQSDNMEVFTSTGIERFEQEIQSANNMLNILNQTQSRIAQTAAQTDLFPANAVADMNNMQNRLQMIQQRIQAIENNPLDMGTDTANAELEQLRRQLDQAVQEQENLNRAVDNMDVEAANQAYLNLSRTVSSTESYIRDNIGEQESFNREIHKGTNEAGQLMQTIKKAVAAYATIQTASKVMDLSDQLTNTTARLEMMNDGFQDTQQLQNMIFQSAERSRGSYQATADAVSKMGLMAGDAFSSSREIVDFMEQVNKQFIIAGTGAAGIDAAMLQLTQAMGSGVLRGEEFNSILEQAPTIIQAIADYMNVPKGQLKDMASEGLITAEVVKSAMFDAAEQTNKKFEDMPKTFEQIWTSFQNNALMAFQPVLQRMNEILNSEKFQMFVDNATSALSKIGTIAVNIFDLFINIANAVSDNWDQLVPIIEGVTIALVALKTAQWMMNIAMYACPLTWIIIAVAALVVLFVTFTEEIVGACYWLSALFINLGHWFGNLGHAICTVLLNVGYFFGNLGQAISAVIINIGYWFGNLGQGVSAVMIACGENIKTAFSNAWITVQTGFWSMVDYIMQGLTALAQKANDCLGWMGVNIDTSGFDFAAKKIDELNSKKSEYVDISDAWEEASHTYEYKDVGDAMHTYDYKSVSDAWNTYDAFEDGWSSEAYDKGAAVGAGISDWIDNLFNFSSGTEENDPTSGIGSGLANAIKNGAELAYSPAISIMDEINDGVGGIAGNTGDISDSLEITEEDLKYLRDIAEQETINRFTTAEITIEQTNHNTVSGKMDLDGIISGLTDATNEAADIIAEGVHV